MAEMTEQEQNLVTWLADMNEDDAFALAKKMLLEEGANPLRVLELCRNAMDIVGKRFEKGEYFLPELVLAGEMLENIGAIAKPLIKQAPGEEPKKLGKVLIGTVHGDLHDIGKNIVTFMLDINGFEVKDIGIDVPVKDFIDEINAISARRRRPVRLSHAGLRLHEGDDRGHSRRRPARQAQDHDRRRPDRRDRAQLHRGRRLRHQRHRRGVAVQELDGGRRMNAPQTHVQTPEAQDRLRRALAAHHGLRRAETARPHADLDVRDLLAGEVWRHQPIGN